VCPSKIPLVERFRVGKRSVVQAVEPAARVRWLDAREQLRRERVEGFEREHGESESAGQEQQSLQTRLEAVLGIVETASR
jgi:hypothetical protein